MTTATTQLPVVELMAEYETLGLAAPSIGPPKTGDAGYEEADDTRDTAAEFEPPELARILELPSRSGYGANRKIKLDSFDEQVDLDGGDEGEFAKYAVLVRREINQYGKLRRLQLEIQSPRLRAIFRDKAWQFREINVYADPIIIPTPYYALFFLHEELQKLSEDKDTAKLTGEELKLLVRYIRSKECLGAIFDKWQTLVPFGKISFDILWTLFRPYKLVYFHRGNVECCYLLENCEPALTPDGGIQGLFNVIRGAHDSSSFGVESLQILIPGFQGNKEISTADLEIIPFEHLSPKAQEDVKARLIKQTERYLELQKARFTYLQIASGATYNADEDIEEVDAMRILGDNVKSIKINTNGRLVADWAAFEDRFPKGSPELVARNIQDFKSRKHRQPDEENGGNKKAIGWSAPGGDVLEDARPVGPSTSAATNGGDGAGQQDPAAGNSQKVECTEGDTQQNDITEEDMLICDHIVHGFLLDKQTWVRVHVKWLEEIHFYPDTWNTLQLDSEKKDVIYAMVKGFLQESKVSFVGWEHVVIKKGNGLLFLLHGGPGLGKTYTAEALSEKIQRPLYRITTAELGTRPDVLEERLSRVFKLGHRWGAVVLLDEADIIMAKRDQQNLDRNALVGIFLRLTEYYEGLLFMTTNRFPDLDNAFNNRIHATIEYPPHEKPARKNIWRQLLQDNVRLLSRTEATTSSENGSTSNTTQNELGLNVSDTTCDVLAELDCNGRDIRNIVRAAICIANHEETTMGPQHVARVVRTLSSARNKAEVIPQLGRIREW